MFSLRPKPRPDRHEFDQIVSEHYARVFRFCARRVGDDAAEDIAQETFVTLHQNFHKFNGDSKLSTWIIGIAHNLCRAQSRKRKLDPVPLEHWLDPGKPGPETEICHRETLADALKTLSEEHREVVLLHEIEGLTYAEIAEIAGVPEGTVKSRLHHAFLNLRKQLKEVAV